MILMPVSKSSGDLAEAAYLAARHGRKPMSERKALAVGAGTLVGAATATEAGGRAVGRRRHAQGRHVNDGFFMGPAVNRGYFKARRNAGGTGITDGGASIKVTTAKSFAGHDQNSFRAPVPTTMRAPDGRHKSGVKADHGQGTGRSRGVGRRISHDANSYKAPVPTRMVARGANGKFASGDSTLKVFHPIGRKGGRKDGTSNKIERYTSGSTAGVGVKKSLSLPGQGKVGRRLA